jgi:hypothetical protein
MGKWLAEFQENTTIPSTDSTDTSHDLSVLSVCDQGDFKGKTQSPELTARVSDICKGLAITPDQFIDLTTKEDRELILSGDLPIEVLRAYAKSFAEGIQTGRITFHPKFNHGIPGAKQPDTLFEEDT